MFTLLQTGTRHCSSGWVVGLRRCPATQVTRRSPRVVAEEDNHRHVKAHAQHNGTRTATTPPTDTSSSDTVSTTSGMSKLTFLFSPLIHIHISLCHHSCCSQWKPCFVTIFVIAAFWIVLPSSLLNFLFFCVSRFVFTFEFDFSRELMLINRCSSVCDV